MNSNKLSFGTFAKQLRMQLNLSLRSFSRKVKIDPSNWNKIEKGKNPPPKGAVLERIARALELREASREWAEFFETAVVSSGRLPRAAFEFKHHEDNLQTHYSLTGSSHDFRKDYPNNSYVIESSKTAAQMVVMPNPLQYLHDPVTFGLFCQLIERRYDASALEEFYGLGKAPLKLTCQGNPISIKAFALAIASFLRENSQHNSYLVADWARVRFLPGTPGTPPPELRILFESYSTVKARRFDLAVIQDLLAHRRKIADVGTGKGELPQAILDECKAKGLDLPEIVAMDIKDWTSDAYRGNPNVTIVSQDSPTRFPLTSNTFGLVIVKWVLHHMEIENQRAFLREVFRILEPGGEIVIFEALSAKSEDVEIWKAFKHEIGRQDTWGPHTGTFKKCKQLTERFRRLSIEQQRRLHLLEDYFGHIVVMARPWMPMPETYRTVPDWRSEMKRLGFTEVKERLRVYGAAPIIRMGPPSVRLVFRRPIESKVPYSNFGQSKAPLLIEGATVKDKSDIQNMTEVLVYQERGQDLHRSAIDDVVLLANERIDTIHAALELLEQGIAKRLVVIGRAGEATLPLLDNAVEMYRIEVEKGATLSQRNWPAIRSKIYEGNFSERIQISEAEIIRQIVYQALDRRYPATKKRVVSEGGGRVPLVKIDTKETTGDLLVEYRTLLDREGAFGKIGGHRIVFIHKPHLQLRSKLALDEIFAIELRERKLIAISHTVSYENRPVTVMAAADELIREAWKLVLYSEVGKRYINLRGVFPCGICGLPNRFWVSARHLFERLPKPLQLEFSKHIDRFTREQFLSIEGVVPHECVSLLHFVHAVRSVLKK